MWLVFILLIISFGDQVFHFNTIQSVSIFSFMDYTFVISIHPLPNPRSCRFSPIMSFRSFIVFHRISALLSFWVNFYKRSKTRSWLIFFFVQLLQRQLLKRLSFSHRISFASLWKIRWLHLLIENLHQKIPIVAFIYCRFINNM